MGRGLLWPEAENGRKGISRTEKMANRTIKRFCTTPTRRIKYVVDIFVSQCHVEFFFFFSDAQYASRRVVLEKINLVRTLRATSGGSMSKRLRIRLLIEKI